MAKRKRKKRYRLLKSIIRFGLVVIVPVILIALLILISIILPKKFYWDGTMFYIGRAILIIIPLFSIGVGIIVKLIINWLNFLEFHHIIKGV